MKNKLIKVTLSLLLINLLYADVNKSKKSLSEAKLIKKVDLKKSEVKEVKKVLKKSTNIFVKNNSLSTLGKELISQIKNDKTVANDLPFYKLYKDILKDIKNKKFSKLEPKLNKLYYGYMNYLIRGGINWSAFRNDLRRLAKKYDYTVGWEYYTPPYSAKKILNTAIANNTFSNIFEKVEPRRFKYNKLKRYLIRYLEIPNWKKVGKIPTLKPGMSSSKIPIIRNRLKLVGDLKGCSEPMESTYYDKCLAGAVRRFKIRHGFRGNSKIDRRVRVELNKDKYYYIRKMRLNLDRIKWSKRSEPRVRIELNIPTFRLYVYDGKELVTTMRVVTGKPNHPTPVFSDVMTTVVVNPYWNIPESIVKKEMLKKLIRDPYHYQRQGKYLYKGWGKNAKKIDPASVNWKKYLHSDKKIPYNFRQNPGNKNALGKIKFLFPNKYAVYIHDTPSKRLFFRESRAFSHGCMRIQKPRELLKALSLYNKNIKVESLMKLLRTNNNKAIGLKRKIPIDITYFTAYVDDYGNLHFRKDIYGYDRLQLKHYYKSLRDSIKKRKKKKIAQQKKKQQKPQAQKIVKKSNKKDDYEIVEIGY